MLVSRALLPPQHSHARFCTANSCQPSCSWKRAALLRGTRSGDTPRGPKCSTKHRPSLPLPGMLHAQMPLCHNRGLLQSPHSSRFTPNPIAELYLSPTSLEDTRSSPAGWCGWQEKQRVHGMAQSIRSQVSVQGKQDCCLQTPWHKHQVSEGCSRRCPYKTTPSCARVTTGEQRVGSALRETLQRV